MVSNTLQEDQKYKSFLTEDDLVEISKLKESSIFPPSHLSEFVVKVTSDILKIPITVILSCSKFTVQTVIPKELISCTPIIIACRIDNNFQYSCTQPQSQQDDQDELEDVVSSTGEQPRGIFGGNDSSMVLEKKAVEKPSKNFFLTLYRFMISEIHF